MRNYKSIFLIVILILLIILGLQVIEPSIGSKISATLTTITTIVGFISVFYEMKRSADIDECNFILETYKHFTADSSQAIDRISKKFDDEFIGKDSKISDKDRGDIIEYLQFFELLASLIEKDSISIVDIDRLYGYSFFVAVNNKKVQELELVPYKDYYEGIYIIYPKWVEYRRKHNKKIPFENNFLIK